jgi:hypothetical protein
MNKLKLEKEKGEFLELLFPENWNEMTAQQLLFVGENWEAYLQLMKLGEPLGFAKAKLFIRLIGLEELDDTRTKAKIKKIDEALKIMDELTAEKKQELLQFTDFIFEKIDLTENKLKVVTTGTKRLYGLADGLNDMLFGEFIFTENYFLKYTESRNEMDLIKLVATLYKPAVKNKRIGLDGFDFEANIKEVSKFRYGYLSAIYLHYAGCREAFAKRYNLVFGGGSGKKIPNNVNYGLMNVAFALADLGGLGNIEEIERLNVHLALQRWQLMLYEESLKEK